MSTSTKPLQTLLRSSSLSTSIKPKANFTDSARCFLSSPAAVSQTRPLATVASSLSTSRPTVPHEARPTRHRDVKDRADQTVSPSVTNHTLSLLYASTNPPALSALSAFAQRLALSTSSPDITLAGDLALLEQCFIHESFWNGIKDLPLVTDKDGARRYTHFHDTPLASSLSSNTYTSNASLAVLGNALLGLLTSELLLSSFPHLPTRVTKAALTMYAGPKSLAAVAKSWGIAGSRLDAVLVGKEDEGKKTAKERAYGHLVGGVGGRKKEISAMDGTAGAGLMRWNRRPTTPLRDAVLYEDALASVSRSIIGAIHQVHGFPAARDFVHHHFLSRLLPPTTSPLAPPTASSDLSPLLKFSNPTQILTSTLASLSLPPSSHRLLKESGRLSSHPTFLTGVFSGENKLGEGFGSSLKMSEWRASEDALRRWYLGGRVKAGLPSDAWSKGAFEGMQEGLTEVEQESRVPRKSTRPSA